MRDKTKYRLMSIESKILDLSVNQKRNWLLIGENLWLVERLGLFEQDENYNTYTQWFNSLPKKIGLTKSTLWKYKKIVTMTNELKLPLKDINANTQNGLEQVARIFKFNKNKSEALKYINLLNDKKIKPVELTKLYNKLTKNKSDLITSEKTPSQKLSLSTKIINFIERIIFTDNMLKTSSIMIMVLTITPIK
jgi:hypothetical protein